MRIGGIGFSDDVSPASGPIFEVENADALAALKEAVEGRYRIVVVEDINDYMLADHKDATEFIERMR